MPYATRTHKKEKLLTRKRSTEITTHNNELVSLKSQNPFITSFLVLLKIKDGGEKCRRTRRLAKVRKARPTATLETATAPMHRFSTVTHVHLKRTDTQRQVEAAQWTTIPTLHGVTGVLRKLGDFFFADMLVALTILSTKHRKSKSRIPTLELRIRPHELNTRGNITFRMGHTRWLCIWPSGGACLAKGGKGMTCSPRIAGNCTKSKSETPGTCIDRRSNNARPSDQPSPARPSHGGGGPILFQWG